MKPAARSRSDSGDHVVRGAGAPGCGVAVSHHLTYGFPSSLRPKLRRMPRPDGQGGLALALGDPVYLAIADDTTIRRVTRREFQNCDAGLCATGRRDVDRRPVDSR